MERYPWYEVVEGSAPLEQGDFVDSCPVVVIPARTRLQAGHVDAEAVEYNVVIMSQSCDLANQKLELVLVCPTRPLGTIREFSKPRDRERLRKGHHVAYHLLNKCDLGGLQKDYLVVDFRNAYGVPFEFLTSLAEERGRRLRLLPPYREHLAQAFARFFMRVGLPLGIEPFC